jgi:hypothetical protein
MYWGFNQAVGPRGTDDLKHGGDLFLFLARCLNVAAGIVMQGFGRPVFKQPSAQTHQARRPNCRAAPGAVLHVGMEISDKGAELNFDCAHGSITQKLVPDNVGRFVARAFTYGEHPGADAAR